MSANDLMALDAILKESHQQRAPELTDSQFFELFAADQILKNFQLTYDELESGRVDGPDDGGVDMVYFLVNRQLVADDTDIDAKTAGRADLILIQATREASFKEERVAKLLLLVEDLLDLSRSSDKLAGTYNSLLLAAIERFKTKYKALLTASVVFSISFYYASKGDEKTVNVALQKQADRVPAKAQEFFGQANCEFTFLGAKELLDRFRRQPKKTYAIKLAEQPLMAKGDKATAIGLVPLDEYHRFITDDDGALREYLFDSNVRGWLGNVKVNDAIRATLDDPNATEDFWWLNNGVTVLASGVSHAGGMLQIDDPQIVNGLQTSRSIYNYYASKPKQTKAPRNVLLRVISSDQTESQDRIIKATNSQTHMPDYQLHATEKVHRDIEELLRSHGLFYERRRNHYKSEGKPASKVVEQLYLAQAVISILLQKPDEARARPSSVLTANYGKVFNHRYPLTMYATCALIMKRIDAYLRGAATDRKDRLNLRFYIAMVWACDLSGKAKLIARDIARLTLPSDEAGLRAAYQRVAKEYTKLGASDQVAKGTDLVARLRG